MFSSRLTAYFRRKGVAVTDQRVQKMNEILNYIKFIKMYAWVKAFSQAVRSKFFGLCVWLTMQIFSLIIACLQTGIREEERQILEKTGYFQSITVGVAPIVVVIASVATFSTHMLLGYDLTAAQVGLHCLFWSVVITTVLMNSCIDSSSLSRHLLSSLFSTPWPFPWRSPHFLSNLSRRHLSPLIGSRWAFCASFYK